MSVSKPIIADPMKLHALGLRNLTDMAALIHIGRCGIVGTQRQAIADVLRISYDTSRAACDRLFDLGLIAHACRHNGYGSPYNLICSKRGWDLLTAPADFSLFPHAQLALKTHGRGKKS